jgi:hypothetical protein
VLVYVANNKGVAKPPCSATVLDPTRTTHVTVTPTKFNFSAVEEWLGERKRSFLSHFHEINDHFAKTGSGQT